MTGLEPQELEWLSLLAIVCVRQVCGPLASRMARGQICGRCVLPGARRVGSAARVRGPVDAAGARTGPQARRATVGPHADST